MGTVSNRKLAVITGASSGIGLELARQCAAHDFDVVVCADETAIHAAAASIDPRAQAVQADLSTRDGVEQLAQAVRDTGRPVEALLLNAGIGIGGRFIETDLDAELRSIALNCNHTVHLAKRIVPGMVARGRGRVLITASLASTSPSPYFAVYGATKAFVMSFAEALRLEVASSGVTVTALQPGATDTKIFERGGATDTKLAETATDDPAYVARRGFDAMMAGKDAVLGGTLKNRLAGLLNEVLPETLKARLVGKTTEPGSGKR
jgi:short-subunit dehydrogenase